MARPVLHTYWRSSSAYRVRIALAYKGIDYEPAFVNLLAGEQRAADYVATRSPMGVIPCLVIDGKPFVESTAILELLEETHPQPPLLPSTPEARANVRALVQIINSGTQPFQNPSTTARLGDDKDVRAAWTKHFMHRGLSAFEARMRQHEELFGVGGPFAYGDALSMADVLLVPQLYAARRFEVDVSGFARILRAEAAALALPAVASARPEVQPDAKP